MIDTTNSLYQILLDTATDADCIKLVVEEFIRSHWENIEQVNLEIVRLILCFLGIEELKFTSSSSGSELVNEVLDFIKENPKSAKFITCEEHFRQALFIFFEYLFGFSFEFFPNENSFVHLLSKLAKSLASNKESTTVRYCGYMIELKFVSALIQNDTLFNSENLEVDNYAKNLFKNAIYEYYDEIPISALIEYEKWLHSKPEIFLKRDYYDSVLMYFGHPKIKIALTALNVTLRIFSESNLSEYCALFVSKLCEVLEKILETRKEEKIFELICKICVQIHKRYISVIHDTQLCSRLWLELFSLKRSRAKMAAILWFKYELGDNTNERKIQQILQFLGDADGTAFSVLVDTLIFELTIITDWNLFVKILTNRTSLNFSLKEKEKVLKLMAFSMCQSITGKKPDICFTSKNLYVQNYRIRRSITRIVLPHLMKILTYSYSNQTLGVLFFMLQHLDFKFAKSECVKFLMNFCREVFLNNCEIAVLLPSLRLMKTISEEIEEKRLHDWCNDILSQLEEYLKCEFSKIVTDVLQEPHKYLNSEIKMETNKFLKQFYILNLYFRLDDKYVFQLPTQILHRAPVPDNPVFLMTIEICISIYTNFIVDKIRSAKDNFENVSENLTNNLKQYVQIMSNQFDVYFTGRLGEAFYFGLSKVLLELSQLKLSEEQLRICSVYEVQVLLEVYVRITICGFKMDKIKAHLNDSAKYEVFRTYMFLVINDIVPLSYTYNVLGTLQTNIKITKDVWREFLVIICQKMKQEVVSKWLLRVLELQIKSDVDSTRFANQLATLFIPMKDETQKVLLLVHKIGIAYAVELSKESGFPVLFMETLTELTACLKRSTKDEILIYINDKNLPKMQVIEKYISELKKPTIRIEEETSSLGSKGANSRTEDDDEQNQSSCFGLTVSSSELTDNITRTSFQRFDEGSFGHE